MGGECQPAKCLPPEKYSVSTYYVLGTRGPGRGSPWTLAWEMDRWGLPMRVGLKVWELEAVRTPSPGTPVSHQEPPG